VGQVLKALATGAIVPLEVRVPDVDPAVATVVGRLLSLDRDARPASADATLAMLDGMARGGARAPRARRSWMRLGIVAAVTAGLAATAPFASSSEVSGSTVIASAVVPTPPPPAVAIDEPRMAAEPPAPPPPARAPKATQAPRRVASPARPSTSAAAPSTSAVPAGAKLLTDVPF
jgi:hypothetical protein